MDEVRNESEFRLEVYMSGRKLQLMLSPATVGQECGSSTDRPSNDAQRDCFQGEKRQIN